MGILFFIPHVINHKTISIFTTWDKATNYLRNPPWKQRLFYCDIMLLINILHITNFWISNTFKIIFIIIVHQDLVNINRRIIFRISTLLYFGWYNWNTVVELLGNICCSSYNKINWLNFMSIKEIDCW